MPVLIRIVGLVSGAPCPFDGQLLVEYDPTRPGRDPSGGDMTAHIVVTDDPSCAARFADTADAHATWTRPSGRTRPDGEADRPLTAFNIMVERTT